MKDATKPEQPKSTKAPKKLVPRIASASPVADAKPEAIVKAESASPVVVAKGPVRRPKAASAKPSLPAAEAKPAKQAKAAKPGKPEKAPKPRKIKLVRDGFAMPEAEYAQLAELKKRLALQGVLVKKSELLRAGVGLLVALSDARLKAVMAKVERVKTGRPAK